MDDYDRATAVEPGEVLGGPEFTFSSPRSSSTVTTEYTQTWELDEPLLFDPERMDAADLYVSRKYRHRSLPGSRMTSVRFVTRTALNSQNSAFSRAGSHWEVTTDSHVTFEVHYPLPDWFRHLVGWIPDRPIGSNYRNGPDSRAGD